MRKLFALCLFCMLGLSFAGAQPNADYQLLFQSVTVDPSPNTGEYFTTYRADKEQIFRSQFFKIVQFFEIPGPEEKRELKNAGLELLDYLPHMAYFAALQTDFDPDVLRKMGIRSIIDVKPEYKLALNLAGGDYPAYALVDNSSVNLIVSTFPNLDVTEAADALSAAGLKLHGTDVAGKYFYTTVQISEIRRIAALPFVMYIEAAFPEPVPENYTARTQHHTNVIASDYEAGRHYDGSGVQVMLQDDGIIGPHIDYAGRIGAQYLTNNNGDHGDHCAGIIFGAGNVDPRGKGNAFGADLFVYSVSPGYPGFTAIPTVYNTLGIRVTSASYGDGCNTGYTSLTRSLDQQVRLYPGLMHVFSAGNSGSSDCGYGAGAGWGNITGGHKVGKNVIAVANLDYQDNLASSSSRGPAHDGRIKPDVGAKGTSVYSTINPHTYEQKSGTSMACPGTAGTLAQLIQGYRALNGGNDPMAGLLKAILLNTAEDLGNPGPDFKHGWGRINAMRAVQVIEDQRYDSGFITQGATLSHTISVPANTAQLRVMVYWTDYEAVSNASVALVNNLNINLVDPFSTTWYPWVLSHFPHPDSLNKPATRGIDNLNNMEQVSLDNPAAGVYTLNVQGFNVPQGPQTYYFVYELIPASVILTYPIGGEALVPGESETIRWDAMNDGNLFVLEYSPDNGQSWDTIVANLPAAARSYNWVVAPQITHAALVRVSRGTTTSQCEAPFSVLGVPCKLIIDWACDDALRLSWSEVMGVVGYEVMKLGEKYMEPVGITSGTSYIVSDTNANGNPWLTVRAIGADSVRGRRATAITKPAGTFNCHPADVMMLSAPTAEWGVFQACMALNEVKVPVVVRNSGYVPIVNPTLHYRLNNGPARTEYIIGTVPPDSLLFHVFADKIDISASGDYLLTTWVDCPADLNHDNDTLKVPFEVIEGNLVSVGYIQTFDTWTKCSGAAACGLLSCTLAEGWINQENNLYDDHDWRTYSGSTSTILTGPDTDHTTGTSTGKYLYTEPSVACLNKLAAIGLPCIDLATSAAPGLKLWYHAYGADIGSFHVDLFAGGEVIMDVAPPLMGSYGNEWKELNVDLTPWAGQIVGMRFRGITSCRDRGDFAIDDISINEVITATGDDKNNSHEGIFVYPNPTSGRVFVSSDPLPVVAKYNLRIIDMLGRIVYSKPVIPVSNRIQTEIDLSDLLNGIYLLELNSDLKFYQKQLIIRR